MAIPLPTDTGDGESATPTDDQPQYTDDPLDGVVQDNIEIDCIIGQGPMYQGVPIDGRPFNVVELEVQLTEGTQTNYAHGWVVPDGHNYPPDEGDPLEENNEPDIITIDVDNTLMEERDDADGEITRIFTGVISNASRIEHGLFEFMAFWPGFNEIQNGSVSVSLPPPEKGEILYSGESYNEPNYTSRRQYASIVADEVAAKITEDTAFDYTVNLTEEGTEVGGVVYGDDNQLSLQSSYVPITVQGHEEGILQRIVNATNSVWEVDRYGNFHIGPPIPDGDVPTAVTSHKLRYITESSAGKQSPAWRSIVVIGDGVVSQDGWGANAQINENPQKYAEPVTDALAPDDPSEDLAEPVFEYTNLEINTAREARHVLDKLKEEIRKQAAGGSITVVGHPEVWPGDAVELPDTENQPFARERFGVSKVIHRINNSDGFLTKIEVMGQTNANETTWSDEVTIPPNRYESGYTEEKIRRLKSLSER